MALQRAGRLGEAALEYEHVLAAEPRNFDALQLLGLVRLRSGDPTAGLALLGEALIQHPGHVATLNNAGNALRALGDLPRAIEHYRRAVAAAPAPNAVVLRNLGSALFEVDFLEEARVHLYAALDLEQNDAVLWAWVGNLERACNRPDRALVAVQRALALDPTLAEAYRGLGMIASGAMRWQDARLAYERGLRLVPGMMVLRTLLFGVTQVLAHWDGWQQRVAAIVDAAERSAEATDPMRLMLGIDDPALLRQCADRMATHHAQRARSWAAGIVRATGARRRRIRIGYVSGDLREHPVAQLLAGVIEHHDREQFEVCCYALGATSPSPWRIRIDAACERVVALDDVSEQAVAIRLAAEDLDLLVDLMGHTEPGIPRVLATRPGAVQVSWLGYPGTLGAGLCDYLIADPVVVPGGADEGYAEAIARMPHCLLPADRTRVVAVPRSRHEYGLPDGAIVLCCFARIEKVTPEVFEAWMAAMRACPDAVLWLARPVDDAIDNLAREAEARGVARHRIFYADRAPDAGGYLARYEVADVALDTFPYGSHSTALDAVWVGCPLVAYAGRSFQARVSASVVMAAGAPELVAADLADYLRRIVALARDAGERARIRRALVRARHDAPLFDVRRFTRDLEVLYSRMHARRLAGLAPAAMDR